MDFEEEELRSKTSGQEEPEMDSLSGSERGESSRNVVDFHSAQTAHESVVTSYKMKVIVIEPKTFDDAQQVANNLREKSRWSSILKRRRRKMPSALLILSVERPMR